MFCQYVYYIDYFKCKVNHYLSYACNKLIFLFSALRFDEKNVKAMYRKTLALKELGKYKDALEQAQLGMALDSKVSFSFQSFQILCSFIAKS